MRDMLGNDDDGADEDGVNDIDITRMVHNDLNNDYQLGVSEQLKNALRALISEFSDIFSYSVKGKATDVSPWSLPSTGRYGKQTLIGRHHAISQPRSMTPSTP